MPASLSATDEQWPGGVLLSKLGYTGYGGIVAAIDGTTNTTVSITCSSAWALLANGDYLDTQLATASVTGNTTNGTYLLWLDESTDGLHTPAWSVAAAAPSGNALAVAVVVVGGNVLTHVAMLPSGVQIAAGRSVKAISNTVARTDTSAKDLFGLAAGTTILALLVTGVASDAASSATLSVGKVGGNGHDYLNAFNVKTGGELLPSGTVIGTVGASPVVVTGIYAETGTASTTGGPYTVTALIQ